MSAIACMRKWSRFSRQPSLRGTRLRTPPLAVGPSPHSTSYTPTSSSHVIVDGASKQHACMRYRTSHACATACGRLRIHEHRRPAYSRCHMFKTSSRPRAHVSCMHALQPVGRFSGLSGAHDGAWQPLWSRRRPVAASSAEWPPVSIAISPLRARM